MAAVVLGLSLSFTACSDDDDDNNGSEQKKDDVNPLDTDEARTAFRWLCQLTDATTLDDNWKSKTYEPTIGQASDNSQYTRIVVVNDLDEAKLQFSKLADMDMNVLGTAQTVNGGAAGTMTWTPSKEGAQNLAEVAVSSRILPHLQKIVYCTEAQVGQNGWLWDSMKGTAYYRLGDVVRDIDGYYWICVRPSFAPDKAESHWINVFNASASGEVKGKKKAIPTANVNIDYDKSPKYGEKTIKLPTKLPYDREHIYNLTQLVWAMLDPVKYDNVCLNNAKAALGGFDWKFHGSTFLNHVSRFWDEIHPEGAGNNVTLWEALFGMNHMQMKDLKEMNLFYQGYKWWWGNTADMWMYSSNGYKGTYTGSESGDKRSIDVVDTGFDINRFAGDPDANKDAYHAQFVKDNEKYIGYWVVRYKRGDKLCTTGKYSPYEKIGGCDDIYVYNKLMDQSYGEKVEQKTESDFDAPQKVARVGYIIGTDGQFYVNKLAAQNAGTDFAAMVVYAGPDVVEKDSIYTGLAFALKDCNNSEQLAWTESDASNAVEGCSGTISKNGEFALNGLYATTRMATHKCNTSHKHPAAEAVWNLGSPFDKNKTTKHKFSRWFIPSVQQYLMASKANGYVWDSSNKVSQYGEWPWVKAGAEANELKVASQYMTTTEFEEKKYCCFTISGVQANPFQVKTCVRPMMAFKVVQ